jgi:hypothetical protein
VKKVADDKEAAEAAERAIKDQSVTAVQEIKVSESKKEETVVVAPIAQLPEEPKKLSRLEIFV